METEDSINNARAMIGWDRPVEIQDDGDLKKYRIELPNLYDDSGLDPYEFRLLAHYKRVGVCTEGTRTTADKCLMSNSTVSSKRRSLHKKGFIVMNKIKTSAYEYSYKITIVDRWQENFNKYYTIRSPEKPPRSPDRDKESSSSTEDVISEINIFQLYEKEIGVLTPLIANSLEDAEKEYPINWIIDAFKESATNNKRSWKYCETILKRWKAQGNQESNKPAAKPESPAPVRPPVIDRSIGAVPRPAHIKRPANIS